MTRIEQLIDVALRLREADMRVSKHPPIMPIIAYVSEAEALLELCERTHADIVRATRDARGHGALSDVDLCWTMRPGE